MVLAPGMALVLVLGRALGMALVLAQDMALDMVLELVLDKVLDRIEQNSYSSIDLLPIISTAKLSLASSKISSSLSLDTPFMVERYISNQNTQDEKVNAIKKRI